MEMKKKYNKEESKPSHAVTEICNSLLSTDRGYETKSRLCPKCIIKVNDVRTFIVIKKRALYY